jgi:hypothetical protein
MSGAIRTDLNLDRIEIHLHPFGEPPQVKLIGSVATRQPRAGMQSKGVIVTKHLGRLGEAWINEMREVFDSETPSAEKETA